MNIFAFSPDPVESALWLDDKRKNKMILESAQMLSTAARATSLTDKHSRYLYKSCYFNHPCTIWVRESRANFLWLTDHMQALTDQRGLHHKCNTLIPLFYSIANDTADYSFSRTELTPFAKAAARKELDINFNYVENPHEAYRQYISVRWQHDKQEPTWDYGEEPDWRVP